MSTLKLPGIATQTLKVRQYTPGVYVAGKWVRDGYEEITFVGSLQPATGKELQLLPEGSRTKEVYKLYSDTRLRTVHVSNSDIADQVEIENRLFDVTVEESYFIGDTFGYGKYLIVRAT